MLHAQRFHEDFARGAALRPWICREQLGEGGVQDAEALFAEPRTDQEREGSYPSRSDRHADLRTRASV
jgi:hypothetical protein